ncbi:unnamed protein product [Brassica oleracea var. botrytis]
MGDCVIGAFISIFESVAINFGTNLLKLRHNKVDEMNSVMAEMMNITAQEAVLRKQCQGFLSIVTAMQKCRNKEHAVFVELVETREPIPWFDWRIQVQEHLNDLQRRDSEYSKSHDNHKA